MMSPGTTKLYDRLLGHVGELGSVLVAFSGGVDSAVVLGAAVRALGRQRVLAITGRSPAVPSREIEEAARVAAQIGVAHEFVETGEFSDPNYTSNPSNRCYFCKSELYGSLAPLARQRGLAHVANGVNADDLADYRPGLAAAREQGVVAPLAECGIRKAQVREIAIGLELSVADKPASPCLSSRVQYGEAIDAEKLARIDQAEQFLQSLGFRECRVRHHGDLARIEVPASQIERLASDAVRRAIDAKLLALGYRYVTLDARGLRSGSMNEVLVGPRLGGARP